MAGGGGRQIRRNKFPKANTAACGRWLAECKMINKLNTARRRFLALTRQSPLSPRMPRHLAVVLTVALDVQVCLLAPGLSMSYAQHPKPTRSPFFSPAIVCLSEICAIKFSTPPGRGSSPPISAFFQRPPSFARSWAWAWAPAHFQLPACSFRPSALTPHTGRSARRRRTVLFSRHPSAPRCCWPLKNRRRRSDPGVDTLMQR